MLWFILRVKNRKSAEIEKLIGPDDCWVPRISRWTKPARKHKPVEVQVPLIPGWVFVKMSRYGSLPEMSGVHGTLKYGRRGLLEIEDEALDGLREAVRSGNRRGLVEPEPTPEDPEKLFLIGDLVRLRGLFDGQSGPVIAALSGGLYRVELGSFRVEVHSKALEPVT